MGESGVQMHQFKMEKNDFVGNNTIDALAGSQKIFFPMKLEKLCKKMKSIQV